MNEQHLVQADPTDPGDPLPQLLFCFLLLSFGAQYLEREYLLMKVTDHISPLTPLDFSFYSKIKQLKRNRTGLIFFIMHFSHVWLLKICDLNFDFFFLSCARVIHQSCFCTVCKDVFTVKNVGIRDAARLQTSSFFPSWSDFYFYSQCP